MQAKAKRGHHYQTSFTRNVKGISLSEKEETTTKHMKMTKKKKKRTCQISGKNWVRKKGSHGNKMKLNIFSFTPNIQTKQNKNLTPE